MTTATTSTTAAATVAMVKVRAVECLLAQKVNGTLE